MSQQRSIFLLVFIGFLFFNLSSCKTSAKLPQKTELKSGEKFTYRLHRDTDIEMNLNGRDQISTHKQTLDLEYEVLELLSDGAQKVELTYKTIKIWQVNGFRTLSFDSETEGQRENLEFNKQVFQNMLGQKLQLTLGAHGEVIHFSGASRIIDEYFKEIKNIELLGFYRAVREQMGDLAMKEMLKQLHTVLPPFTPKIDDTWASETSQLSGIGILKSNIFQLKKLNSNGAEIRLKSTVEPNPNARVMKMGNSRVKFDLKGFESGTYQLENLGGMLQTAKISTNLSGSATITREDNLVFPSRVVVRMETEFEKL